MGHLMRAKKFVIIIVLSAVGLLSACQEDRKLAATDRQLEGFWSGPCIAAAEVAFTLFTRESLSFGAGQYRYSVEAYEDSNCVTVASSVPVAPIYDDLFGEYRLLNSEQNTVITPSGLTAHRIHFERDESDQIVSNIIAIIDRVLYLGMPFVDSVESDAVAEDLDLTRGFTR